MTEILIVDDSAVVRQVLTEVLSGDPALRVIGAAADPLFAEARMRRQWPDVIVLDIEMPRMDGLTFLRRVMAERPTPVVICSSLAERNTRTSIQAMEAGAVAVVCKPKVGLRDFFSEEAAALIATVKSAARANLANVRRPPAVAAPVAAPVRAAALARTTEQVVAIGTSTGGTQALAALLPRLALDCPGVVVVQHMPERFTAAFAERLDQLCAVRVKEARDGDRLLAGQVLLAPGGRHMQLTRSGAQYGVRVQDGPRVNRHKPSVDVLFRSVAQVAGANALGLLLTGMGDDGARGLLAMREAGGATVAQDEASSVVYGMPREAVRLGAADRVLALEAMAEAIAAFAVGGRR